MQLFPAPPLKNDFDILAEPYTATPPPPEITTPKPSMLMAVTCLLLLIAILIIIETCIKKFRPPKLHKKHKIVNEFNFNEKDCLHAAQCLREDICYP
jgi:hypothetical protein